MHLALFCYVKGIVDLSQSAIEMDARNATSISFHFEPWNSSADPTRHVMYYLPQYRTSSASEWINSTIIDHQINEASLNVTVVQLEPDIEYVFQVIPVYDDRNYIKYGVPTQNLVQKTEGEIIFIDQFQN